MEIEYSYTVIKYRHDAATGEVLNVGVVLYSAVTGQVGMQYDHRYVRLSQAFAHFDGELYKRVLGRLNAALEVLANRMTGNLFEIHERSRYSDVTDLIRIAWPDQGLSYFHGPVFRGISDNLEAELNALFDRFVLSQFDRRDAQERFDDERLWDSFKRVLTARGITHELRAVSLGPAEVEFEHAYKNERWHVIEPLSLDYLDGAGMKRRAYEVAGKAAAVRDVEDMGTFTVLLGHPRRISAEKQLMNARRVLLEAPGNLRIIEDSQAEEFATHLEREMREHGVLLGPDG